MDKMNWTLLVPFRFSSSNYWSQAANNKMRWDEMRIWREKKITLLLFKWKTNCNIEISFKFKFFYLKSVKRACYFDRLILEFGYFIYKLNHLAPNESNNNKHAIRIQVFLSLSLSLSLWAIIHSTGGNRIESSIIIM